MRVVVIGAGAIGGSLAALLVRAGSDVTLVARGDTLAALREAPLRVSGVAGDFGVRLRVTGAALPDGDVYVVTVKTPDLAGALATLPKSDAPVVTMQNGLAPEAVAAASIGEERVVGCVTSYDAEMLEPGAVRIGRIGGLTLGSIRGPPTTAVDAAKRALAPAMPVETTTNLAGARWMKLLVNLNNAIPAATGLSIQQAYADPRLAGFSARMLREGVRVARAERVRLEPLPWVRPPLVRLLAALPEPVAARALARKVTSVLGDAPAFGSTYQSIARGRATEIDHLNGEIVRIGRRRRMRIAANAAVQRAVRRVQSEGRFWSVDRLLNEERPED